MTPQEQSDFGDLCHLRFAVDQDDMMFSDEQLEFIIKHKFRFINALQEIHEGMIMR
jgi:hypothetical protein